MMYPIPTLPVFDWLNFSDEAFEDEDVDDEEETTGRRQGQRRLESRPMSRPSSERLVILVHAENFLDQLRFGTFEVRRIESTPTAFFGRWPCRRLSRFSNYD